MDNGQSVPNTRSDFPDSAFSADSGTIFDTKDDNINTTNHQISWDLSVERDQRSLGDKINRINQITIAEPPIPQFEQSIPAEAYPSQLMSSSEQLMSPERTASEQRDQTPLAPQFGGDVAPVAFGEVQDLPSNNPALASANLSPADHATIDLVSRTHGKITKYEANLISSNLAAKNDPSEITDFYYQLAAAAQGKTIGEEAT